MGGGEQMLSWMIRWSWSLPLVLVWTGTASSQQLADARSVPGRGRGGGDIVRSSLLDRPARLLVEDVRLEDAVRRLATRSGVPIAFSPSLLDAKPTVSCTCQEHTVRQALVVLLGGTALSFSEAGGQVLIEPESPAATSSRAPAGTASATQAPPTFTAAPMAGELAPAAGSGQAVAGTITGQVVDSMRHSPITGAQVYVVRTGGEQPAGTLGSTTDDTGH